MGSLLETYTWQEAERLLTPETLVVIPLGAGAKEHGPHLPLCNDWLIAEYLKDQVLEKSQVVVVPTVNYHYYPAFVEYPGSICLRLETARDLIVDICHSLARFGPRRFYVLNTGVSTVAALEPAAEVLAQSGIILHYTDLLKTLGPIEAALAEQEGGTHADEIETSMMLALAPQVVQMEKAVKDYHPYGGRFTRNPDSPGTYSPTGIWGDPTLASREKGEKVLAALVQGILNDIEALRGGC